MFDALKRMIGAVMGTAPADEGQLLVAWAKAEGHVFKRASSKAGGGYVVEAPAQWRLEWGDSQRSYISGKELRFRCDVAISPDVQMIWLSRALAQVLEADVFSRFTNAMQTQIDDTLPDEMRWLAMHPRVSLSDHPILARRLLLLSNAEAVAHQWMDEKVVQAVEEAAASWWTDNLVLVITVNRGMLTLRMPGQGVQASQLKSVAGLYEQLAARLRGVAA